MSYGYAIFTVATSCASITFFSLFAFQRGKLRYGEVRISEGIAFVTFITFRTLFALRSCRSGGSRVTSVTFGSLDALRSLFALWTSSSGISLVSFWSSSTCFSGIAFITFISLEIPTFFCLLKCAFYGGLNGYNFCLCINIIRGLSPFDYINDLFLLCVCAIFVQDKRPAMQGRSACKQLIRYFNLAIFHLNGQRFAICQI